MPIITTFMFCEQAELNPQTQKLQVISPIHVFTPAFVPGMFSFSLVFGVLGVDPKKENTFQISVVDQKEEEIILDTGIMHIPSNPDDKLEQLPPEMRGMMVNMDFRNVIFRKEGIYKAQIYINSEKTGEFQVPVRGAEKS
jgi:hypothetical protein